MIGIRFEIEQGESSGFGFGTIRVVGTGGEGQLRCILLVSAVLLADQLLSWCGSRLQSLEFVPMDSRSWLSFEREGDRVLVSVDGRLVGDELAADLAGRVLAACRELWTSFANRLTPADAARHDLEVLLHQNRSVPDPGRDRDS